MIKFKILEALPVSLNALKLKCFRTESLEIWLIRDGNRLLVVTSDRWNRCLASIEDIEEAEKQWGAMEEMENVLPVIKEWWMSASNNLQQQGNDPVKEQERDSRVSGQDDRGAFESTVEYTRVHPPHRTEHSPKGDTVQRTQPTVPEGTKRTSEDNVERGEGTKEERIESLWRERINEENEAE
jgi:hypothetical protein